MTTGNTPGGGHEADFGLSVAPDAFSTNVADYAGFKVNGVSPTGFISLVGSTLSLTYATANSGQAWTVAAGLTAPFPGYVTTARSGTLGIA